ncbi:endonuclease III [Brevibacterium sp. 5221]|uniref:Endonuclease III n=1 Tax=Brevibacterium rongguiense TaxID=2695267 RepID=A0A6N9H5A3_9MICO|nr:MULTISPECIES: endonuclease III [Brevibacterium]MYM19238.1 endonuclease III [Brevibacterium rongguiense]WAL39175.1 endonuclease III [Brevibacterium sp. BRM-1]
MRSVAEKSERKFAHETHLGRVRRARRIDRELARIYPDARAELDFSNAFELLIATVLSAQTTDIRVNEVTPELFAAYPDAAALADARLEDVEAIIRPTGFFRAKAKNIVGLSQALVADHGGEVPGEQAALVALPGVGVKTANVVLGNAFGIPGLTIDTHVGRLARRLGYTRQTDPLKVEADLTELFARRDLTMVSHRLIFHGRRICHAKRPACGVCPISALCPSFGIGELDPEAAAGLLGYGMAVPR